MKLVAIVLITLVMLFFTWSPLDAAHLQPEGAYQIAGVSAAPQPKRELVTFVNQHYRFGVTYPSRWERIQIHWDDPDEDARSDTATIENPAYWNAVMFNQRGTPDVPSIVIYVHQKQVVTLEGASQRVRERLQKYKDTLQSSKETIVSGLKAYEFVLLFPSTRNKWQEVHLYHEGWRYVVHYAATPESFEKFRGEVSDLLKSFRLVK